MINYPLQDEGPLYEMIYGDKVYEEGFTTKDNSLRSIFCFSKSWIQRILLKIGFLVGGIRKKLQILIFPFYQKILSK